MSDFREGSDLLAAVRADEIPDDLKRLLAQGLFPVEPEVLFQILLHFAGGEDEDMKQQASATLAGMPPRVLMPLLEADRLMPDALDTLADILTSVPAMQRIGRHRNTAPMTIIKIARTCPPPIQEIIVTNVGRLINHPEIVDALEENPKLDVHIRRRIREIRHDYLEKPEEAAPEEVSPGEPEAPGDEETVGDLFEIPSEIFETFGMQSLPEDMLFSDLDIEEEEFEDEEEQSIYQRVLKMTVPQKVEMALKGSKEARGILIRDANKLVKAAVVLSPKVTESEINAMAGMKDMPAEVMRAISQKREWMRKYPIVRSVIYNPHTPVGVSLTLLPRMNDRDLKDLANEKDVPDPLRQAAKRLHRTRKEHR